MTTKNGFTRRSFLRATSGIGASALFAPMIGTGLTRRAFAQSADVIRILVTAPTMNLTDWSAFEAETGLKTDVTIIKDDPGLFLNEIMVNDGGERFDIITTLGGTEKVLAAGGFTIPLDTSMMPNWDGVQKTISEGSLTKVDGKIWSIPYGMNADSFGYLPETLGLPEPPEEISWATVFDNEKAMGKTSMGDTYVYLQIFAAYCKATGKLDIANIESLTGAEAEKAADLLIDRKKAGQFRNFWSQFDDQVNDIKNGEVYATACWEPAVIESRKAGVNVQYASTKECYWKWMYTSQIPAQVADRGNAENVYKALNWFMGGTFATLLTPTRGYVTARPDLGKQLVQEKGLGADISDAIDIAVSKVEKKFSKEMFWFDNRPEHLDEIIPAMDRVKAA